MKRGKLKILVIFDGSNFYHGVKNLNKKIHLSGFSYRKFSQQITHNKLIKIKYCVGKIRKEKNNKKSNKLYAAQQKLFHQLNSEKIDLQTGYMMKIKNSYHEKGVDVRIAIEIVRGALKNEYDVCYLISSDTDLIPAVLDAQEAGKQVIYVGFKKRVSRAMKANCSNSLIIAKRDLQLFC